MVFLIWLFSLIFHCTSHQDVSAGLPYVGPDNYIHESIEGYNCNNNNFLSRTTFSLRDVMECETTQVTSEPTELRVQIIQTSDYIPKHIMTCDVFVHRTVSYCGSWSHISLVHNGLQTQRQPIGAEMCKELHKTRNFRVDGSSMISDLIANSSTSSTITRVGTLTSDGKCTGGSFANKYGSWSGVVVQEAYTITLEDRFSLLDVKTDRISVGVDGITCASKDGYCYRLPAGDITWISSNQQCTSEHHTVLYEGLSYQQTHYDVLTNSNFTYLFINQSGYLLYTEVTGKGHICYQETLKTEYPKLYVVVLRTGMKESLFDRNVIAPNVDLSLYFNTKITYMAQHIGNQVTSLYNHLYLQQCKNTRRMTMLMLSLARDNPQHISQMFYGPGYYIYPAGEVLHLIKCAPISVSLREVSECYDELPVIYNGTSGFLSPVGRIWSIIGTVRPCNSVAPGIWKINAQWLSLVPHPVYHVAPETFRTDRSTPWVFQSIRSFGTGGIYTEKQLSEFSKSLLFPSARAGLSATMITQMSQYSESGKFESSQILEKADKYNLGMLIAASLWGPLAALGYYMGTSLLIIALANICIWMLRMICQTISLYWMYGISWKLLSALSHTISSLVIQTTIMRQVFPGFDQEKWNKYALPSLADLLKKRKDDLKFHFSDHETQSDSHNQRVEEAKVATEQHRALYPLLTQQ